MVKITDNEEYLSQLLKQKIEITGEVDKAIELLVAEQGIPKRIAQSLACGLNILPTRYEANGGTIGSEGQKHLLLSKVMVVGLGGLGCQVVEQLVRPRYELVRWERGHEADPEDQGEQQQLAFPAGEHASEECSE